MVPSRKTKQAKTPVVLDSNSLQALQKLIEKIATDSIAITRAQCLEEAEIDYRDSDPEKVPQRAEELANRRIASRETFNWYVRFTDNSRIGPVTLERVLEAPNRAGRLIKEIEVENGYPSGIHMSLQLGDNRIRTVEYEFAGDDQKVQHYAELVETWFDQITPWYGFMYNILAVPVISSILAIYIVVSIFSHIKPPAVQSDRITGVLLLVIAAFWITSFLLYQLRKYAMPACIFAVGAKKDIMEKYKWTHRALGAFLLGTVLKAAWTYLAS